MFAQNILFPVSIYFWVRISHPSQRTGRNALFVRNRKTVKRVRLATLGNRFEFMRLAGNIS